MKRIKNKICFLIAAVLLLSALPVLAADVSLSVQVVARTPLDTINDFDFSTVNQTYESGQVAGVSTTASAESVKWCPATV